MNNNIVSEFDCNGKVTHLRQDFGPVKDISIFDFFSKILVWLAYYVFISLNPESLLVMGSIVWYFFDIETTYDFVVTAALLSFIMPLVVMSCMMFFVILLKIFT